MTELKRLFKKLQTNENSVVHGRDNQWQTAKNVKKSKYDKDKKFVKLFDNNVNFLEEVMDSIPIKATFVEKKTTLAGLPFTVLTVPFNFYMLMLETSNSSENLPSTLNIFSCLLTFLHWRYTFTWWSLRNLLQLKWKFFYKEV